MKTCRHCKRSPPDVEFGLKRGTKDGLQPLCRRCHAAVNLQCSRNWRAKNAEKIEAYERVRQSDPAYRSAKLARDRSRLEHHRERVRQINAASKARTRLDPVFKAREKTFPSNSRSAKAARQARREASEVRATPRWVDLRAIEQVYVNCAAVSEATGQVHHVDHIYPLRNPLASGLHVPWNLRIVPAAVNLKKGNRLPRSIDVVTQINDQSQGANVMLSGV